MYDIVVKSSRSLSRLLSPGEFLVLYVDAYGETNRSSFNAEQVANSNSNYGCDECFQLRLLLQSYCFYGPLWNRTGHYIFALWFLSFFFLFFLA